MNDDLAVMRAELARQQKINAALMRRVERDMDVQGDAFSLFQAATVLEKKVHERTAALGAALDHVTERWSKQSKTLLDACAHISNHLRFTKNQHVADDSYISGTVSSIALLDEGFDDRKGH